LQNREKMVQAVRILSSTYLVNKLGVFIIILFKGEIAIL